MKGLKQRIKEKTLTKVSKKLQGSMPDLMDFATNNDQGYEKLISTIKEVNQKRKRSRKYTYKVSERPGL